MEVQVEQLTPVLVEYSISVGPDRVKKEVDKAYVDLAKRARVKGFRPGKAPREVLTQLYSGAVLNDVATRLVDETLNKALTDKNVTPLSQPKIEVKKATPSTLEFKARFEVRPVIGDLKWEGLDASKPKVAVAADDVKLAIENLRKAHATLVTPEPARAAKAGDLVTIDFTATLEGKALDSGKGVTAELGEGKLVKELEDALVGVAAGSKKDVDVAFPDNHANPALRGKKAAFSIELTEIKERRLPNLDDEFAKDCGDYATLAALEEDTRKKLEKQASDNAEQQLVTSLVAALCNANPVEAPPTLVQQQAQLTLQELRNTARRQGQQLQMTPELERQLMVDSEVKVRAGLLMAEIAQRNTITVDDKDLEKGLEELAQETGKNIARLRVEYRDQQKRQMLIGMILEDKVLDVLIAKANVKETE
ncbi:MAG: trigger factor [Myxococcales bacterium]|nr:trigger factor [Myxococcales bacterium]